MKPMYATSIALSLVLWGATTAHAQSICEPGLQVVDEMVTLQPALECALFTFQKGECGEPHTQGR